MIPPCNTTFATSEIYPGPITIAGPLDLQVLEGKRAITGTLTIAASMTDISLPNIEYVGGGLELQYSGSTATVELPALCHIGHEVLLGGAKLASIDLRSLREVGGEFDVASPLLTSLTLPSLVTIGGQWWIYSPLLTTLSAPNLTDIAGALVIEGNIYGDAPIASLQGLASLTNVRSIVVADDSRIVDLKGLEHVRALPEGLSLGGNPNMRSLDGLHLDPGPVGNLALSQLPRLQSIAPLSAVTSVVIATDVHNYPVTNGFLVVVGTGIVDLSPLSNVANVEGRLQVESNASLLHVALNTAGAETFYIDGNPALADISFPNLVTVHSMQAGWGADFVIENNAVLANISFPVLTHIDLEGVIVGNPMLPTCQATNLAARVPTPYGWNITNNGTGTCPTASRRAPSGP